MFIRTISRKAHHNLSPQTEKYLLSRLKPLPNGRSSIFHSPQVKISFQCLPVVLPRPGLYIISGYFNAKHTLRNNAERNRNGSIFRKIIPSYTIIKSFISCTAPLTPIGNQTAPLPALPFSCQMSPSHKIATLQTIYHQITHRWSSQLQPRTTQDHNIKPHKLIGTFAKNCSRFKINQKLTQPQST